MSTGVKVAGTAITSWFLNSCCLHADIRDHQQAAGSALAAAMEMSADLIFVVIAVTVMFGVAVIVISLGKSMAMFHIRDKSRTAARRAR